MTKLILITGPRRSGKTYLAEELAKRLQPFSVKVVDVQRVQAYMQNGSFCMEHGFFVEQVGDIIELCDILTRRQYDYIILDWLSCSKETIGWLAPDHVFLACMNGDKSVGFDDHDFDLEFRLPLEYYDMGEVAQQLIFEQ